MRPSQILRGGAGGIGEGRHGQHGKWLGEWGAFGGLKQKGIITYSLSSNQQKPFAGAFHAAIFNTWRRVMSQLPYMAPPMLIGYFALEWAIERNHYLNSKAGRAEFGTGSE